MNTSTRFGFFCCLALLWVTPLVYAQDLDTLIRKNLAARGGEQRLEALTSIRVFGAIKGPAIAMDFGYAVADGKIRLEYAMADNHIIMILTENEGWQLNPMMGVTEPMRMGAKETAFLREMGDIQGPMHAWRTKKHQIRSEGKVALGDGEAYQLDLTTVHGHHKTLYLSTDTFLVVKTVEHHPGKKPTIKTTKAYQTVNGVVFPKQVEKRDTNVCVHERGHDQVPHCPGYYKIVFTKVETEPDLCRSLFRLQHKKSLLADAGQ